MIKPNQTSRYRTGLDVLSLDVLSLDVLSLDVLSLDVLSLDVLGAAPTGPVRTMAWPGSLARTAIMRRRPRSSPIAVGFGSAEGTLSIEELGVPPTRRQLAVDLPVRRWRSLT
jgi:hypothetical protein